MSSGIPADGAARIKYPARTRRRLATERTRAPCAACLPGYPADGAARARRPARARTVPAAERTRAPCRTSSGIPANGAARARRLHKPALFRLPNELELGAARLPEYLPMEPPAPGAPHEPASSGCRTNPSPAPHAFRKTCRASRPLAHCTTRPPAGCRTNSSAAPPALNTCRWSCPHRMPRTNPPPPGCRTNPRPALCDLLRRCPRRERAPGPRRSPTRPPWGRALPEPLA